jgi:class 3 adenylate cyclase
MCFLDTPGYTRLTQERGDAAAADLATRLARLVERTSVRHGGRPVIREIGPVELKGVSGTMRLHAASVSR